MKILAWVRHASSPSGRYHPSPPPPPSLPVGRCHDHNARRLGLETIELSQQLVHGVVTFVVPATGAIPGPADSIQLVNEYDTRGEASRLHMGGGGGRGTVGRWREVWNVWEGGRVNSLLSPHFPLRL